MTHTTVLVAGAAGMMGQKIVRSLLENAEASVRVLLRPGADDSGDNQAVIAAWKERGVDVAFGNLADQPSLEAATRSIDVVISAVQGGEEVIVDGQVALANAAHRNGVRRMFPSDLSVDFFDMNDDDHVFLGQRHRADIQIATIGIEQVNVLIGAFMEIFVGPFLGIFDVAHKRAAYWGDGKTVLDLTSTDDAARYIALAAVDPACPAGKLAFAGDQVTMLEAIAAVEHAHGVTLEAQSLGSVDELKQVIAKTRATAKQPMDYVALQYQWAMISGRGSLTNIQNHRYPQIRPTPFSECLAQMAAGTA